MDTRLKHRLAEGWLPLTLDGKDLNVSPLVERLIKGSPATVMARLGLERALEPQWLDALFEQHSERQYTRELLFSTTVDLMSLVAVGLRPSLHAAAKAAVAEGALPVSITALYDKVNRTEPAVIRALVASSAQRLGPVLGALAAARALRAP